MGGGFLRQLGSDLARLVGRHTVLERGLSDTADITDDEYLRHRVVEVLRFAGAPFEVQETTVPEFAVVADEIALEVDDVHQLLKEIGGTGAGLPIGLLDPLYNLVNSMSQAHNDSLWSLEALNSNEQWAAARIMARKALSEIGEEWRPPQLDWATYVKG